MPYRKCSAQDIVFGARYENLVMKVVGRIVDMLAALARFEHEFVEERSKAGMKRGARQSKTPVDQ